MLGLARGVQAASVVLRGHVGIGKGLRTYLALIWWVGVVCGRGSTMHVEEKIPKVRKFSYNYKGKSRHVRDVT